LKFGKIAVIGSEDDRKARIQASEQDIEAGGISGRGGLSTVQQR
jgi:hypothetical protein